VIAMLLIQAVSNLPSDASALESSISALRSSIAALESSIDSLNKTSAFWEKWPYGFTAAVVIGVLMEAWVIRADWRDDMDAWALTCFGLHRLPGQPSRRKLWMEYISVALVAVGVAGELGIGIAINVINGKIQEDNSSLRTDSDQLVAFVTRVAGSAAQSALIAQGAAKQADEDAGKADKKATHVGEQAVKVEQALDMVQYFSSSRTIQDWKSLKTQLEQFRGQSVVFRSYRNDGDGYFMCGQLTVAAQLAGMLVTNQCGEWPFPDGSTQSDGTVFPSTGITVFGSSESSMLAMEGVMSRVNLGFGAMGMVRSDLSGFVVFIGKKSDVHVGETAQTRDAERRAAAMKKKRKPAAHP
jgi:hypothetical protein